MLLPAELEARLSIPMVRSILARKLILEHSFTQEEAAKAMGVTQAAISNYLRGVRGMKLGDELSAEICEGVGEIVNMILQKRSKTEVAGKLYALSKEIRRKRLLCGIHKELEPSIDTDSCYVCEE